MKCPYCKAAQGRCATMPSGRSVTECTSCGRITEERQSHPHHLFLLRAQDSPLCLVTPDLPAVPTTELAPPSHPPEKKQEHADEEEDPFHPSGFITAFSTWSLEHTPIFARSSLSFSGHLAELERALESSSSGSGSSGPPVVVDYLRAYLQIIDVASILGLDHDISDHAFQLFRDCSSATCLRNRSVEALATAALVQAIREAQEPRTLQEISIAANLPQKEIGKYIKILGEALQLSQPINSNSIIVHMPRFCTLLQLNKSAQELATHIGEVVVNKCFCTRRNPISISAAAIYLACQLEDKRKTQAEICKVTGLTEVTLRKVYKELLENWDDLLPSDYTPAVPPEKAFPTTTISSGRSLVSKVDHVEVTTSLDMDTQPETKPMKPLEVSNTSDHDRANKGTEGKSNSFGANGTQTREPMVWLPQQPLGVSTAAEESSKGGFEIDVNMRGEQTGEDTKVAVASKFHTQYSGIFSSGLNSMPWRIPPPSFSQASPSTQYGKSSIGTSVLSDIKVSGNQFDDLKKEESSKGGFEIDVNMRGEQTGEAAKVSVASKFHTQYSGIFSSGLNSMPWHIPSPSASEASSSTQYGKSSIGTSVLSDIKVSGNQFDDLRKEQSRIGNTKQ